MAIGNLRSEATALLVVDLQPKFLAAIHGADRVARRSVFLAKIARLLSLPVLGTVQNASRMGGLDGEIAACIPETSVFDKMAFSCAGCLPVLDALVDLGAKAVVIVGIETHICISQTAHDLQAHDIQPVVCADAVSSRTLDRHEIGLARMRDAGVVIAHSESIAYEWMRSADDPKFREALEMVKGAG